MRQANRALAGLAAIGLFGGSVFTLSSAGARGADGPSAAPAVAAQFDDGDSTVGTDPTTTVPDSTVPDTTVPDSTVPDTTTTVPDTTTTVPDTTTTVPDTTTTVPDTSTTVPDTTMTVPDTTTTVPDTTMTVPDTSTTVPDTTTTVPDTSTTVPDTTTTVPDTTTTTTVVPGTFCLGDRVWIDLDADGVQDDGEPGLVGVSITVTNTATNAAAETATIADGAWQVCGLDAGTYVVAVTGGVADDLVATYDLDSGLAAPDETVTIVVGDDNAAVLDDVDFGYTAIDPAPTGAIGDTVYFDANRNGTQDDGERGVPGVTVDVRNLDTDQVQRVTTDDDGRYLVDELPAGRYVVIVVGELPDGFEFVSDPRGETPADGRSSVTLGTDEVVLDQDFGIDESAPAPDGIIDVVVYLDLDGNGSRSDGEPPVGGQTVTITSPGLDGAFGTLDDVVVSATTDDDGRVRTDPLPDGPYRVDIVGGVAVSGTNSDDPDGGTPNRSFVTIVDGANPPQQVFGYTDVPPNGDNAIGDTVWNDVNADGVDDGPGAEPRLAGVHVTITWLGADRDFGGGDDRLIGVYTTDENGRYQATGLPDGRFSVVVTSGVPAGFEITVDPQGTTDPDGRSTVTVVGGQTNRDQDFGYVRTAPEGTSSIGDRVYLDTNGDGRPGDPADEPGIPGVTVVLTLPGGQTATAVTDGNGNYLFDGLSAGTYLVEVDESTLPDGLVNTDDEDGEPDSSTSVELGDDDAHLTADFGYSTEPEPLGSIGDRVYLDTNGDGSQGDPSDEPGIPGVTVTLTFPNGSTETATTDGDGNYLFDRLPAGDYTVTVSGGLPAGATNTDDPDGPAGAGDSTSEVRLSGGENDLDQDFGYDAGAPGESVLGDRVWLDRNDDGVQDPGEPGLNGVTVVLTLPDGSTREAVTTGDGDYLFTGLDDGRYTVTIAAGIPGDLGQTYDADDGVAAVDRSSTTDLVGADLDQDFGFVGGSSIGDLVFDVTTGDGIGGVRVTIIGNGFEIVTTTDDDGNYLVDGLPAGRYTIVIDQSSLPDGVDLLSDPDDATDPDGSSTIVLGVDDDRLDQDFGAGPSGAIGDRIYLDTNGDGVQGDPADEPGIPGVTVTLTFPDGSTRQATTDDDGNYLFDRLPAGEYTVTVTGGLPDGVDNTADPDGSASPDGLGDSTSEVTIGAGERNLDQDFGYAAGAPGESLLGDRVWWDLDRDGVQDAGEPGLNGVTVTLELPDGSTRDAVTTGDGDYLFTGLDDGTYTVTVTGGLPEGLVATYDDDSGVADLDETSTTVLDGVDLEQDFGYVGTGSIGDTIALDRGDGDLLGLPGVTVTVTYLDAGIDIVVTTDDDGRYLVDGLPAGDYRVTVDTSTLPDGVVLVGDPDGGDDSTSRTTLGAGDDDLDQDFTYAGTGSIGDRVYLDTNGDGIQGDPADEPGIDGVTVVLTYPSGATETATTDENGNYLFDDLPAGDYTVTVTGGLPDEIANTDDPDGPDGAGDSTSAVSLDPGESDLDQDFGYAAGAPGESVLGDRVWLDLNRDGVQDPNEPGLSGVTVTLTLPDGSTSDTVTVDDGTYLFTGLDDGTYTVTATPRPGSGLAATFDADSGIANPDETSTTDLVGADLQQDFGYVGTGSIGDLVFFDTNRNGTRDDGEVGLGGVRVTISGNGFEIVATTDDEGRYLVEGLPSGTYTVVVDPDSLPEGVEFVSDPDGIDDGAVDGTSVVVLGPGEERLDQDFGVATLGAIGDRVYLDTNGDGVQGDPADEPGIPGVTVTLTFPDGSTESATTDDDGNYLFDRLPAGEYVVTIMGGLPDNVDNTDDPDGAADPDAPGRLGDSTSTVDLGPGERDLDQDFGYAAGAPGESVLGDRVWFDRNRDGVQDAGEPGINGVTVTATDENGVVLTTVTAGDGDYLFSGLDDGTYTVTVTAGVPAGLGPTGDADSPADGSNTAGDETSSVDLVGIDLDQDFGYAGDASLGDRVWLDTNRDGVEDPDEPGIGGVTIVVTWFGPDQLLGTADDLNFETTTGDDGRYAIDGIPAGAYRVTLDQTTLPDGVAQTYGLAGGADDPQPTVQLNLPAGASRDDVDFGYTGSGVIGDTVYLDFDGDGVQGDDEPGVPGQRVTLVGDNGVVDSTVTDENGNYRFEGLPDGTYTVTVDGGITDAATNTGDPDGGETNTSTVVLDQGAREDLDQDFGYRGDNGLGDTVWFDENADGNDDATEPGIDGVDVIVTWFGPDGTLGTDDDLVLPTLTTTNGGDYGIDGLPDGSYSVEVDRSTLPGGFDPSADSGDGPGEPTDGITVVGLSDGTTDDGIDFGFTTGGSISGTVLLDQNANGTGDVGEPGLGGIRVVLTGPDGLERETFTDDDGNYTFPGLSAGEYIVTVDESTLPGGVSITFDSDGNDDGSTPVTLGDDEDRENVDFGYVGEGEIGGTIFLDLDGNGTQDPGEPSVPGQTVTVTSAGPDGQLGTDDDVVLTTTTDDGGDYLVDGLPDGEYAVTVGPGGLADAADNTADPDGVLDGTTTVTLGPDDGRSQTDEDFGYRGDNSIGDTVYLDANGNGVDDGAAIDPRVPDATITVTWAGVDGLPGTDDDIEFTTTTDDNGEYGVSNLPDGTYTVVLDPTSLPTGTAPLNDPDDGAPDGVSVVELSGGTIDDDQDFGVGGLGVIGDSVWLDLDGDGVRDLGEPGLAGATVTATLLGADGEPGGGDDQVFTTTVDESGNYLFEGLPAGDYIVEVSGLPGGLVPTFDSDGGNDGTSRVTIGLDEVNLDQDFGFAGTSGLDGTVFDDIDDDQTQDAGEPGVPGVDVIITWDGPDGPIVIRTQTDSNGDWSVDNLPSGSYTVTVDPTSLPANTTVSIDLPIAIELPVGEVVTVDIPVGLDIDLGPVDPAPTTTVPATTVPAITTPTTTPTGTGVSPTTTAPAAPSRSLPTTGSAYGDLLVQIALAALLVGAVLLMVRRRDDQGFNVPKD
ncbi:MAG: SdrD B-like domain-containing protein [Ilumatobacter sp.]|uniref:SdrD B-like domain-containing protein n=1 Tax=Ilumatobacter sp. TaxID=1967498 RepID=UPI00391BDDE3